MMNSSVSEGQDSSSTQHMEHVTHSDAGGDGASRVPATSDQVFLVGDQVFRGTLINSNTHIERGTGVRLQTFDGKLEQEFQKAVTNTVNEVTSTPPGGILNGDQVFHDTVTNNQPTPPVGILNGDQVLHGTVTNSTTIKSTPLGGTLDGTQVFHGAVNNNAIKSTAPGGIFNGDQVFHGTVTKTYTDSEPGARQNLQTFIGVMPVGVESEDQI